jgi:hypothetical protein
LPVGIYLAKVFTTASPKNTGAETRKETMKILLCQIMAASIRPYERNIDTKNNLSTDNFIPLLGLWQVLPCKIF